MVSRTTERALLGECKGHPVLMFYIRKEVLEAVRKRKRDSIALDDQRSSNRLRQRARRAGNSKEATEKVHAADAARHQEHRAVLSEAHSQNVRAANTARDRERRAGLPEADLQTARAANTARDRERRAARLQERRAEDAANDGCAGRTLHDFDAQAKQKIRDFISPSNMGRDTCACCNELNPPSEMHAQPPSGAWLACLQRKLKWEHTKHTVNEYTRNFYDVSDKIPALSGVPLARDGIQERNGAYKVR